MYVILLHSVLSFLSDQYFPVFRQNDHKRPHFLLRGVLKSVVKGP